jgi:hypothetical protein
MKAYLQSLYRQREILLGEIEREAESAGVASYSLSDGDGSQSTTRRSLKELYAALSDLNTMITQEERKSGGGLTSMRTAL